MQNQTKTDRMELIASLPDGTRRVKVLDIAGKEYYKKPEEIDLENDVIQLNKYGEVIIMRGQPGLINKLPSASKQVEDVQSFRSSHVGNSKLVSSSKRGPESDDVFNLIMKSLAQDVASLEFEIHEHNRKGLDPSNVIAKKSKISKAMADAWIARRRVSKETSIDIESEQFSKLFTLVMSTMKEAMETSGTRKEHIETIFNRFSAAVSKPAWRLEAKKIAEGDK
jgi:hypothetical protein